MHGRCKYWFLLILVFVFAEVENRAVVVVNNLAAGPLRFHAFLKKTFCIVCQNGWGPFELKIWKIQSLVSNPARHPSILSIEKGWRGVGWNNWWLSLFFYKSSALSSSWSSFKIMTYLEEISSSSPSPLTHMFNVGTLLGLFEFPHSICVCFMPALWHHHNRHHYHLREFNLLKIAFSKVFRFFCTLNLKATLLDF